MIRRHDDYSFLQDEYFEKIANSINNTQKKLVKVTNDIKQAKHIGTQLLAQGYKISCDNYNNEYYIYALPREKINFKQAMQNGTFKKIASNQYIKQANNTLGLQHYDFDEGTIWKVITAEDGKEYLVKEVSDTNIDEVIRQKDDINKKITVTASNNNKRDLIRLCKILYNNFNEEFIQDIVQYAPESLSNMINDKLNNIINSELKALNITSSNYHKQVREKIAFAIESNKITNRQQISNIIQNH